MYYERNIMVEANSRGAPTTSAPGGWLVAGIDSGTVQQMFGDDLALFKSLLGRLLRDFADLTRPVPLDDQASRDELLGRVHKLKGSAGIIGATRVIRFAGAAESALQQGRNIEAVEKILGQLAASLTTLRENAAHLLEKKIEPTTDATPATGTGDRPSDPTVHIRELQVLLESQNLAATGRFSALSRSFREILGAVRFDELRGAIDDLDFPRAARLLRESCP